MILLFVHLVEEIIEQVGVVAVLHHAERETLEQRDVVKVMLERPPLQSLDRQLAGT
jgi:hypothetical protein